MSSTIRPPFYPRQEPEEQASFEQFSASQLYCPRCGKAMPVRQRMLLVLADGEMFDYLCVGCGSSLGTRRSSG